MHFAIYKVLEKKTKKYKLDTKQEELHSPPPPQPKFHSLE